MIFADAVPWSNVVLVLGLAAAFVAVLWILSRHGLEIEFRDPPETKPPEWRYERTTTRPKDEAPEGDL